MKMIYLWSALNVISFAPHVKMVLIVLPVKEIVYKLQNVFVQKHSMMMEYLNYA